MKQTNWENGARVLVEDSLNVQSGEDVLIVSDSSTSSKIVEMLGQKAIERGARLTTCIIEPTGRQGAEPPPPVAAAMKAANAILMPTLYSITHTNARKEANATGARIASLPGVKESVFTEGSLNINIFEIAQSVHKITELLKQARSARITSESGTDIRFELTGRDPVEQTGICHEPGTWGVLPSLETAVLPAEGTAEGTWVIDGVVVPGGMVKEHVKVTFSKGRVMRIEGGEEAKALREFLEKYNDPRVYDLVEVGIGMNPKAKMGRSMGEDEAEYGTMHLGIGDGTSFGSSYKAPVHCDIVIRDPVFELDGKVILRNRSLLI